MQFLAPGIVFGHEAHGHIGHQQGALAREAGIAELSVYATLLGVGNHEFVHHLLLGDVHHHHLGGLAVLHVEHVPLAHGLYGVYLGAFGCPMAP